ncbi:hypothetical protein F2A31_05965 [Acinetobacter suaedae]|uniref:Uncharacterized protein n=1 Tax=Acinetobacter suaedae TaxID=2609668 RepID=A0A5P1UTX5_9GAMM|nr:hypothetical protein [Acinetobacter sp. C16S1]QER39270.1 hypothetical protein F2A31_05965 [Acinetobacter sp. C16S1]
MAKKHVLHPIQTLKDWEGEDWDVYEERKTQMGFTLYLGWLYGAPRLGSKSIIMTMELVEYLKMTTYRQAIKELGLSSTVISRMRRILELQKKVVRRDRAWIVQHQNEILYYSFPILLEKYGLSKSSVLNYSHYLVSEVRIKRKSSRNYASQYAVEKIYQKHKAMIAQCRSFKELQKILQTDDYTARKFHELACAELNVVSMSELHLKNLDKTWQWRYQHRDTILSPTMTIQQIAKQLKTTTDEIYNARKALRRRLAIKERIGPVKINIEDWVLQHAEDLETLKMGELKYKYQMSKSQISHRRMILKKLK